MDSTPTCAPPRRLVRHPRFVPPPGAWDCHCHVFGPARRFPYDPRRSYTPHDAGAETLFALHETLGFTRAVLVQPAAHGGDHAALLDALGRAGGRYRGVVLPPDPAADLADLHRQGVRGVRFNLVPHLGPPPPWNLVRAVTGRIGALGWHIVLHAGPEQIGDLARWTELGIPVIVDHMCRLDAAGGVGQPAVRALVRRLGDDPLLHLKLSGIDRVSRTGAPFADALPIARALFEAAPNRCFWGTDFPHPNHAAVPDDADLVDLLPALVPDAADQQRLLVETPGRLYG